MRRDRAHPDRRGGVLQLLRMLWDEAGVDVPTLEVGQVEDHGVVDRGGGQPQDDQLRVALPVHIFTTGSTV